MTEKRISIGAKVPSKIKEQLTKIAHLRGEDESDLIRRAVYTELARLGALTPEERKALGVVV
jgi:phage portal protein BeeE